MLKFNPNTSKFFTSAYEKKQFIDDGKIQIALSGRSNVGKSSLINTLLQSKKFARTSSSPGKTVSINYYLIDNQIYFVDLPGYGYAKRSEEEKKVWSKLTNDYLNQEKYPNLIIQLIDLKVGPTSDDLMMLSWLKKNKIPFFVVATKVDKLSKTEARQNYDALFHHPYLNGEGDKELIPVIAFSSETKEGRNEVISLITQSI